MKRIILAVVSALILAAPWSARAADLAVKAPPPPAPVWSWTGFYLGVNGGGAWGRTDFIYTAAPQTSADHSSSGGLAGGTVGYNWAPTPYAVFGLEADWDWADIYGSTTCPVPTFSCQSKIRDLGTLRGRIGYTSGQVMLYGTAGLAWGDVRIQTVPLGGTTNGQSTTRAGYAAGLGAEYGFTRQISGKIEWLYYDLGHGTFAVNNGLFVNALEHGNMLRGGLNLHF